MSTYPDSLMEAVKYFSDLDVCEKLVADMRWPDGSIACPRCGHDKIVRLESRRLFRCKSTKCRYQFSVKKNTIFEDSPLGLDKWLCAIWSVINCKNGCSSHKLARDLQITQKAAWHMVQRIRLALESGTIEKQLEGDVEADETFIGGKARNMHQAKRMRQFKSRTRGTGSACKVVVLGILERKGEIRAQVVPDVKRRNLDPVLRKHVKKGSKLYTDALPSYDHLDGDFAHRVIDHLLCYAKGEVHTNGMENFWSLLKRGLKGTYISVEPWHLHRYLAEQAFRFNTRKMTDGERFNAAIKRVQGKRLTYKALTSEVPAM